MKALAAIDIGTNSIKLLVSNGSRVLLTESLPLGVVRLNDRHGKNDPPSEKDLLEMKKAIRAVARRAAMAVRKTGFKTCVGSAGTIQSLSLVQEAVALGREPIASGHRTLSREGLKKVNRILRRTTQKEKLRVPGLDPRRRDIAVPGGLLLAWILKGTGAEGIVVGEWGLREGIILDYAARHGKKRVGDRDVRARSVDRLRRRANAEVLHASHVARLALQLFDQTHALHQLTSAEREWLQYGALLHDVGCSIGFSGHQQHSYYLITHGDLTGFSAEEIEVIASVARYHKGKGPRSSHENWKRLDPYLRPVVEKLAAILRIADGLDRSHRQLVADVIAADAEIDRMEMVVEEQAVHLLALQQPVAVDLRFLVAALKINNDLERIGDHAVNIAEGAERLAGQKPFKPFIDINYMAEVAMSMLKQSLHAFLNRDASLARQVIKKDDILDDKNVSIIRELLTYMAEYPNLITYSLELISISKNLERVGDLASNICEDTIYMAKARWVKHHATELI